MAKAKPFRDRLVIAAIEAPMPEVSETTMDVNLPVAQYPQSPEAQLVSETVKPPKTSTGSKKSSAKDAKVHKNKCQTFPKFKKFHSKDLPENCKRQTKVSDYFGSLSWRFESNSPYLPDIPPPVDVNSNGTSNNDVHEPSFWNDAGPLLSSSPLPHRDSTHSIIFVSSNDNVICISDSSDF